MGWLLLQLTGATGSGAVLTEVSSHLHWYAYLLIGTTVAFATFGAVLGHLADRLRAANARLSELAMTDTLTSLHNARYFHARLDELAAQALRGPSRFALIMIDLDHFKEVNDRFGHDVGDEVLKHAANVFVANSRGCDVVCRVGGEEFGVLCAETALPEALELAERLREHLAGAPASTTVGAIPMTASFGVATIATSNDSSSLVHRADQALYDAKRGGRNRVAYARLPLPRTPAPPNTPAGI